MTTIYGLRRLTIETIDGQEVEMSSHFLISGLYANLDSAEKVADFFNEGLDDTVRYEVQEMQVFESTEERHEYCVRGKFA